MLPGLFISGTDTGIGKTYVAAMIVRELARSGLRVGVYKPIASGCQRVGGSLVSDDALALWRAAGQPGTLDAVCPQCFTAPLAPHLAAAGEGRQVDTLLLRRGLDYWRDKSDIVVVEGAGGLLSPVSDHEYVADVARDLGFPLVIVAANRLGAIHQTLATLTVATTFHGGLKVAGIVLNQSQAHCADESVASNFDELRRRCAASLVTQIGWQSNQFEPALDWHALARGTTVA
jgi:dethiobiotin synthetase